MTLDLEAIAKRAKAARSGERDGLDIAVIDPTCPRGYHPGYIAEFREESDLVFYENALTDIPALLAEVARLTGENATLRFERKELADGLEFTMGRRDTLTAELAALCERLKSVTALVTKFDNLSESWKSYRVDGYNTYKSCADDLRASLTAPANESGVGK